MVNDVKTGVLCISSYYPPYSINSEYIKTILEPLIHLWFKFRYTHSSLNYLIPLQSEVTVV